MHRIPPPRELRPSSGAAARPVRRARPKAHVVAAATALVGGLLAGIAGCASPAEPAVAPTTSSATADPSAPTPSSSPGRTVPLPDAAARRWVSSSDPGLGIDLRTAGAIEVRAGCLSFTGDLVTRAEPDDPAAGAPAGPTVAVTITERADDARRAHCLGFTADQRDFVTTLRSADALTVVGDRLYLSGDDARLELSAAS